MPYTHTHINNMIKSYEVVEESVNLVEGFLQGNASVYLLLCDARELGAEGRKLRVERGLNISLILSNYLLLLEVNYNNWEFYDFLQTHNHKGAMLH